jgi:hypothetical protein
MQLQLTVTATILINEALTTAQTAAILIVETAISQ